MGWVYLDDRFPEHPKVEAAGDEAAWLFVCGLAYVNRNNTGGIIPKLVVGRLTDLARVERPALRLVKVGLWKDQGDYYEVITDDPMVRFHPGGQSEARPKIPQRIRDTVLALRGERCLHCGTAEGITMDHIHPFSKGGLTVVENLQPLCQSCNSRKGVKA